MVRRGVKINIVTNAFEASDVKVVSAGYDKWRKPLLRAGIKLFEVRGGGAAATKTKTAGGSGFSGSGCRAATLHAKTFSVNRTRVFIGSFNLDPRSAQLNTENGLVIESPALANRMAGAIGEAIGNLAYEVRLDEDGRLFWIEQMEGREVRHDTEPGTTWRDRVVTAVLSKLPIDWLL